VYSCSVSAQCTTLKIVIQNIYEFLKKRERNKKISQPSLPCPTAALWYDFFGRRSRPIKIPSRRFIFFPSALYLPPAILGFFISSAHASSAVFPTAPSSYSPWRADELLSSHLLLCFSLCTPELAQARAPALLSVRPWAPCRGLLPSAKLSPQLELLACPASMADRWLPCAAVLCTQAWSFLPRCALSRSWLAERAAAFPLPARLLPSSPYCRALEFPARFSARRLACSQCRTRSPWHAQTPAPLCACFLRVLADRSSQARSPMLPAAELALHAHLLLLQLPRALRSVAACAPAPASMTSRELQLGRPRCSPALAVVPLSLLACAARHRVCDVRARCNETLCVLVSEPARR
jgi:hypothetical protein